MMRVVLADSAPGLLFPSRFVHAVRLARRSAKLLGTVAQGLVFFAVLWLLAAGPGFLSARDSLVPGGTERLARQASR